MPDILYAIPTANAEKCSRTFAKWKAMGYLTAALIDGDTEAPANCDVCLKVASYHGWPWATNLLMRHILEIRGDVPFLIAGGDDMDPEPNVSPQIIAAQCLEHFGGTLGVCQPTGDPWGVDSSGRCAAERICGSPWLGREWIERAYEGNGPWFEGFTHFYADEELYEISKAAGLLWQRKDLTHFHHHWHRTGEPRPAYMEKSAERWAADQRLFNERKAAGFPGSGLK